MKTSAGLARTFYQSSITGLWLVGVFILIRLLGLLTSGDVYIDSQPLAVILLSNIAMATIAIFSFWAGAQRGHWVRAASIVLFLIFELSMYDSYLIDSEKIAPHGRTWAIGIAIIMLNINYARRFRSEYKDRGRVNYFDVYFPKTT